MGKLFLLETTKILEKFGLKPEQMKSVTDLVMAGDLEGVKKLLGETHSQSQISNIIKRVATIWNTNNPITTTDNTNNSPVTENSNELEAAFVKMFPYNEQNKLYYETRFPHLIPEYAKPRPDDGRPIIRLEPTQESDVSNTFNTANQQDIVQPIIGTTKNAIESVVTPESMKTMFDGLSTQESEGVLSDMIGKLQGLVESKGITPEQFKQAVSELEAAAKSKTKQEAVKKVIKTVAPLAALIK